MIVTIASVVVRRDIPKALARCFYFGHNFVGGRMKKL